MYVCLQHQGLFSLRPLIGPHLTLPDPGLSFVNPLPLPIPPPLESSFKNASVDMITNTIHSVSLKLKLAVLTKTLLKVSAKTEEAKSKKELEFFQRHGF